MEEPRNGKKMDLVTDVEDEVLREELSHKLYIPLFHTSNKVWKDSTQTKNPISPFQISEYLR